MTLLQAILLGIIQGSTEFIPVSSSGHMILIPWLFGWEQPGLLFSVVAHLGTATGVLIYFRDDWLTIVAGTIAWSLGKSTDVDAPRMLALLFVGMLPAGIVGVLFVRQVESAFTTPIVPAAMLFVTAVALLIGEKVSKSTRDEDALSVSDSFLIGLGQALALLPGISRSGATISVARLRHLTRYASARFSFLLATPVIFGAAALQIVELAVKGGGRIDVTILVAGFAVSLVCGLAVVHWLLSFLRTQATYVFAAYCVLFGAICLAIYMLRGS